MTITTLVTGSEESDTVFEGFWSIEERSPVEEGSVGGRVTPSFRGPFTTGSRPSRWANVNLVCPRAPMESAEKKRKELARITTIYFARIQLLSIRFVGKLVAVSAFL